MDGGGGGVRIDGAVVTLGSDKGGGGGEGMGLDRMRVCLFVCVRQRKNLHVFQCIYVFFLPFD